MAGRGDNYVDLVQDARKAPEDMYEFDVPNLFGKTKESHVKPSEATSGAGTTLSYTCHTKVFVLWRPWTDCPRCQSDIADDLAAKRDQFTESGEYECPHVQKEFYTTVINKCMAIGYIISHKEYFSLSDGSRCIHLEWLVPQTKQKRVDPIAPSMGVDQAGAEQIGEG